MKTLLIIIICISAVNLKAQSYSERSNANSISINVSPLANRTIYGWKFGASIGLNINNKWEVGYSRVQGSGSSETDQNTFSGTYIQRAINPNGRLVIIPNLRVGLYNGQFLAIQPTIQANYKLRENAYLLIGVGRVDGYANFELGLILKLKKIK
ncbi:MAG: hypothetical protein ACJAS3_001549 [Roseivirga sp.]|jgi:hypothetical protein